MPVTLDPSGTPCTVELVGEVNIGCAAELKEALVEALTLGSGVRVNMISVTGIDLAALQLLWAAEQAMRVTGQKFTLDGAIPDAIASAIRRFGLTLSTSAAS